MSTRGYIRQRGKSWEVTVWDPARAQRLTKSVRGGRKQAEKLRTKMLAEIDAGVANKTDRQTVGALLEQWLEAAKPKLKPSTYRNYVLIVQKHLVPGLGKIRLTGLQSVDIQLFYTELAERVGPKTLLNIHRALHRALRFAVKWQKIHRNPATDLDLPASPRYEPTVLDAGSLRKLVEAADEGLHGNLMYAAISTGMRLSELRGLRWQDVDLPHGTLSVRQAIVGDGKTRSVGTPKSKKGRLVDLPGSVITRLAAHRKELVKARLVAGARWKDQDLVFPGRYGAPLSQTAVSKALRTALGLAGLPKARFHDLRHAHASLLLAQGVNPKIVQERLGHSSIEVTLDIYSHLIPSLQKDAVAGLDTILVGNPSAMAH